MTQSERLAPDELAVYFALMESASLLQFAVEQQLRADGQLSWVQFQILAGLNFLPGGSQRMTDLADRVVYSRSGLTYQATALEKAGHVERSPDPADERGTVVTITEQGRELVRTVMPGHQDVVRSMLLQHLSTKEASTLTRSLGRLRDRMRAQPPRSARPRRRGPSRA